MNGPLSPLYAPPFSSESVYGGSWADMMEEEDRLKASQGRPTVTIGAENSEQYILQTEKVTASLLRQCIPYLQYDSTDRGAEQLLLNIKAFALDVPAPDGSFYAFVREDGSQSDTFSVQKLEDLAHADSDSIIFQAGRYAFQAAEGVLVTKEDWKDLLSQGRSQKGAALRKTIRRLYRVSCEDIRRNAISLSSLGNFSKEEQCKRINFLRALIISSTGKSPRLNAKGVKDQTITNDLASGSEESLSSDLHDSISLESNPSPHQSQPKEPSDYRVLVSFPNGYYKKDHCPRWAFTEAQVLGFGQGESSCRVRFLNDQLLEVDEELPFDSTLLVTRELWQKFRNDDRCRPFRKEGDSKIWFYPAEQIHGFLFNYLGIPKSEKISLEMKTPSSQRTALNSIAAPKAVPGANEEPLIEIAPLPPNATWADVTRRAAVVAEQKRAKDGLDRQ